MSVPKSHPRYRSLKTRDELVEGWNKGLVATQGLIAHGRGEAFDYLIGERTTEEAWTALICSAMDLIDAERPVISVNGNVGALSGKEVSDLSNILGCPCEVNIFHRTQERVGSLVKELKDKGCRDVLGMEPDSRIPGLDHARALCSGEGIFKADVVLVPLEDGDRCKALKDMGKKVITVDLNPLSRTARTADITIVDNLIRALPILISLVKEGIEERTISGNELDLVREKCKDFDNIKNMGSTLSRIASRFCDPESGQK